MLKNVVLRIGGKRKKAENATSFKVIRASNLAILVSVGRIGHEIWA